MKVIHRLFFEKEPLRVEFHCWYNFYVESVKAHSSAFCFHVVDAVGLIWSFCNIIRVENTSGEQCRVKFKFQTSLESNCPKGVYKMIETMKRSNVKKWGVWELKTYGLVVFDWGLAISKY